MAKTSPTQRTLARLKKLGYVSAITETWHSFTRTRRDLLNFIDVIGLTPKKGGVLAIQTTTIPHMQERLVKICTELHVRANTLAWLKSGNRIEIWGWAKRGARGQRKVYTLKCFRLVLEGKEIVYYEDSETE
jgi:hypothetical protein